MMIQTLKPIRALALLLAIGLQGAACSSYVHIPGQRGAVARRNPNLKAVGKVEAEALRSVIEKWPIDGVYQIMLPAGTDSPQYIRVVDRLGEQATWSFSPLPPEVPILWVRQVRLRGWYAEVDIVRPDNPARPDGLKQLVTVTLKFRPVSGWRVSRLRPWSIGVHETLVEGGQGEQTYAPTQAPREAIAGP